MERRFEGKVALITGGNYGIGRAAAIQFAQGGARVVIAARRRPEGEATVALIQDAGGEATFAQTDVTSSSEVEALVQQTVTTYGRLDCAFNNAGERGSRTPTADYDETEWDRVININLKGVWLCMKYEIRQMLSQGSGAIVNTSSVGGLVGSTGVAYIASKHGVIGLTKTAALENAKMGIRVNAVCPGVILSPRWEEAFQQDQTLADRVATTHPIGRAGQPEEVAEAVLWLCSEAASFVTGHAMSIDGGFVVQ